MRLEMGVLDPLDGVDALVDDIGCGEAGIDIADMAMHLGDDVALRVSDPGRRRLVVDEGDAGTHRLLGVEQGGQEFVDYLDEQAGGFRRRLARRHDRGDSLADEADDRIDHQRVVGIVSEQLVARGREMTRWRILVGQHRDHARRGERGAGVDARDPGGGMRRAEDFHMQEPVDRDVHRVAGATSHDSRTRGRGEIAAEGLARRRLLDMADARQGVEDRAIAGAAAEVSLERAGQIATLRLIERRGGHHHAGGAEAALETLGVEKRLLHRMKRVALAGEPLDGRHRPPLGAEGRHETAMHRLAVEMDGAGPAIAGVAAFLDAEPAELAQERAQTLARPRRRLMAHAIDEETQRRSPPSSLRISSANSNVMCRRQSGRPWMSS